jgi:hypothetical protein
VATDNKGKIGDEFLVAVDVEHRVVESSYGIKVNRW